MPVLAKSINADLSRGFTFAQVAEKHGWTNRARYGNTVGLRKAVLGETIAAGWTEKFLTMTKKIR